MRRNITKEWKNLHEARKLMRGIKRELVELDKMMAIAWKEACQPANV